MFGVDGWHCNVSDDVGQYCERELGSCADNGLGQLGEASPACSPFEHSLRIILHLMPMLKVYVEVLTLLNLHSCALSTAPHRSDASQPNDAQPPVLCILLITEDAEDFQWYIKHILIKDSAANRTG